MRVGQGVDVHAFTTDPTRPLMLGGIEIPDAPGLEGHSDADAVLHALTDALLGAAALGDLGELVGVDAEATRDASSARFVRMALERLSAAGWTVGNVDLTVIAHRPRLDAYRAAMRASVSRLLDTAAEAVSVKATTTDGLGALGRGEGIACLAVVSIEPRG